MEIAQSTPIGAVVFTMPRMRREKGIITMSAANSDKSSKDLQAVVEKIANMPEPYAGIGKQLHETIVHAGPKLKPRLWYGMPGYAVGRSTPVLVFFRLDDGVMSLGLSDKANVDREPDSALRPAAWYLDEIDDATLAKVAALVRTAFA